MLSVATTCVSASNVPYFPHRLTFSAKLRAKKGREPTPKWKKCVNSSPHGQKQEINICPGSEKFARDAAFASDEIPRILFGLTFDTKITNGIQGACNILSAIDVLWDLSHDFEERRCQSNFSANSLRLKI